VASENELAIIDASDPKDPVIERAEPRAGYIESVHVTTGKAVLALNGRGCQVVDL
jgi:hypothetical protein